VNDVTLVKHLYSPKAKNTFKTSPTSKPMKKLFRTLTFLILVVPAFSANAGFPNDLSDVVFTEAPQVKGWPVTTSMSLSIGGGIINVPFSATNSWPRVTIFNTVVNANVWGIVQENGVWKAGTWDYLRPGGTSKVATAFTPSHFLFISGAPRQRVGDIYGFFVSGIARAGLPHNITQRSNYVAYEWGRGVVFVEGQTPEPEPEPPVIHGALNLLMEEPAPD